MSGVIQLLASYGSSASPLIFDTYAGQAGYSLRKLRTAYSGSAIRVRRSSDNTEQDIGFTGSALDTTALASFCSGTSGYITTWYDQSGNGYNITQATGASQPRIVSGGTIDIQGGKPALYSDGARLMTGSALPALNTGNNYSIFSVSSAGVGNTVGSILCSAATSSSRITQFCDSRSGFKRNILIVTPSGTYAADMSAVRNDTNQKFLSAFVTSAKAMSSFDSGATGSTDTYVGTYTNNQFRIFQQFSGSTPLTGYIQEILIFSSDQSANRTAIEADRTANY